MIKHVDKAAFPSRFGKFTIHAFADETHEGHIALVSEKYNKEKEAGVLVRIHSKCLTGDTFGSLRCDCRNQLEIALGLLSKEGGILIYLDQEGRGIGLMNKIRAYALQDKGLDTVEANLHLGFKKDLREYSAAAEILKYFKVSSVRLLTNNAQKIKSLKKCGIGVVERIPLVIKANGHNSRYLQAKKEKLNHLLD